MASVLGRKGFEGILCCLRAVPVAGWEWNSPVLSLHSACDSGVLCPDVPGGEHPACHVTLKSRG